MDKAAYDKARDRYDKAKRHLEEIANSKSYDDFKSAWTDFLLAWNTGYTVLEQGAKNSPQSRQWFGSEVKKDRRSDPLIQYMHQARNADEHGIKPISVLKPGSMNIKSDTGSLFIKSGVIKDGRAEFVFDTSVGKPIIEIAPPMAVLVTVYDDRFNTQFDPPEFHQGKKIADRSPLAVATLALDHLRATLVEAEVFVKA